MRLADAFASGRSPDGDVPEASPGLQCRTCWRRADELTLSHLECPGCAAKRTREERPARGVWDRRVDP